jgi:hypothetical protein
MQENIRNFEVTDPFGRRWQVEFRWQQNAISIRHADTIDCKYYVTDGEEKREIVVALDHASLLRCAASTGRGLSDPWCMRLAARHLRRMISSWEDMDKTIVTVTPADLEAHARSVAEADSAARERAMLAR